MLSNIAVIKTKADPAKTWIICLDGTEKELNGNAADHIDRWCIQHGSSMRGRIDAVRALAGAKTKFPILIDEVTRLILFPMRAVTGSPENYWINDSALVLSRAVKRESVILLFTSGFEYEIPFDRRMIQHQRTICQRYREALNTAVKDPI